MAKEMTVEVAIEDLLSVNQVSERLGGLGKTTICKLIRNGELEAYEIKNKYLVVPTSVDAYISSKKVRVGK